MGSIPLWSLQAHWQNQVFWALQKSGKVGINLISTRIMFQREGTTTEKGLLLGPIRWTPLGEGSQNIPYRPALMIQVDVIGKKMVY